jgi:hypothetical protein
MVGASIARVPIWGVCVISETNDTQTVARVKSFGKIVPNRAISQIAMAPITDTDLNRLAADYLKRARLEFGQRERGRELNRVEFAALIAKRLGTSLSAGMYRTYERKERQIPAAVMIAASMVSGVPMIVDEQQGELILDWLERRWGERAKARGGLDG